MSWKAKIKNAVHGEDTWGKGKPLSNVCVSVLEKKEKLGKKGRSAQRSGEETKPAQDHEL